MFDYLDTPKIISMNQLTTKKNMQQASVYLRVFKMSNNLTSNLQKCCKLSSLPELNTHHFIICEQVRTAGSHMVWKTQQADGS